MSIRKTGRRKLSAPSIGDMREPIFILDRNIKAPAFGTESHTQEYTDENTHFAKVETFSGKEIFLITEVKSSNK